MRRRSILAVVAVSALAGCRSSNRNPSPAPGPGQVRMTLTCLSDGSLGFALVPWSVKLPDKHAAFTWINDPSSNVDGVIAAQNQQYPFGGRQFTAHHGASVVGKPDVGTPEGTYKYSVTAICPKAGGGLDTTVVDPDMIIPWKIDQT